jgi:hypothetical protein
MNHEDPKDLEERTTCNFIFAVFAVFAVHLFCSVRLSGQRPPAPTHDGSVRFMASFLYKLGDVPSENHSRTNRPASCRVSADLDAADRASSILYSSAGSQRASSTIPGYRLRLKPGCRCGASSSSASLFQTSSILMPRPFLRPRRAASMRSRNRGSCSSL